MFVCQQSKSTLQCRWLILPTNWSRTVNSGCVYIYIYIYIHVSNLYYIGHWSCNGSTPPVSRTGRLQQCNLQLLGEGGHVKEKAQSFNVLHSNPQPHSTWIALRINQVHTHIGHVRLNYSRHTAYLTFNFNNSRRQADLWVVNINFLWSWLAKNVIKSSHDKHTRALHQVLYIVCIQQPQ